MAEATTPPSLRDQWRGLNSERVENKDWGGWKPLVQETLAQSTKIGMTILGQGLAEAMSPDGDARQNSEITASFTELGDSLSGLVRNRWKQKDADVFQSVFAKPLATRLQQLGQLYAEGEQKILNDEALTPEQSSAKLTELHEQLYNGQILPSIFQMHDLMIKHGADNEYIASMGKRMTNSLLDWSQQMTQASTVAAKQIASTAESRATAAKGQLESDAVGQVSGRVIEIPSYVLDRGPAAVKQQWEHLNEKTKKELTSKALSIVATRLLDPTVETMIDEGKIKLAPEIIAWRTAIQKANTDVPIDHDFLSEPEKLTLAEYNRVKAKGESPTPDLQTQYDNIEARVSYARFAAGHAELQGLPQSTPPAISILANDLARASWVKGNVMSSPDARAKYETRFATGGVFEEFDPAFVLHHQFGKGILGFSDEDMQPSQPESGPQEPAEEAAEDPSAPAVSWQETKDADEDLGLLSRGTKAAKGALKAGVGLLVDKAGATIDSAAEAATAGTKRVALAINATTGSDQEKLQKTTADIGRSLRKSDTFDAITHYANRINTLASTPEEKTAAKELSAIVQEIGQLIPEDPSKEAWFNDNKQLKIKHKEAHSLADRAVTKIQSIKALDPDQREEILAPFLALKHIFPAIEDKKSS